jgi:hypothetical protein
VVVLGDHKDIGVRAIDNVGPIEGVLVDVLALYRVDRLVVEGQIHFDEVDEFDVEVLSG